MDAILSIVNAVNVVGILIIIAMLIFGQKDNYIRYAHNENVTDALALNDRLVIENKRLREQLEQSQNEAEWLRRLITSAGIVINDSQVRVGGDLVARDKAGTGQK